MTSLKHYCSRQLFSLLPFYVFDNASELLMDKFSTAVLKLYCSRINTGPREGMKHTRLFDRYMASPSRPRYARLKAIAFSEMRDQGCRRGVARGVYRPCCLLIEMERGAKVPFL